MFQLIVAVIAIALVIALTLASIFYGGEAFTRSSLKANVAAMVNQAQQISAAATLYKTDFAVKAESIQDLDGTNNPSSVYLAAVPVAPKITKDGVWHIVADENVVYVTLGSDAKETCEQVVLGSAGTCSDAPGNAAIAATAAADNTSVYQFAL